MFLQNFQTWPLEGAKTVTAECPYCNNTSEQYVCVAPYGPQVGIVFRKKPVAGMKKYWLACPVCNRAVKKITKEQAKALQA